MDTFPGLRMPCLYIGLALIAQLSTSTPLTSPADSSSAITNDTSEVASLATMGITSNGVVPLCAEGDEWKAPDQFASADCAHALDDLEALYVKGQEQASYEFLNRNTEPVRGIHIFRLPLKVLYSKI